MKYGKLFSLILFSGFIGLQIIACSNSENKTKKQVKKENIIVKDTIKLLSETPAVFKTPESVKYDKENSVLYVSNVNGKPLEKDGNGFISKLDLDGNVVDVEWITGLNAPKGMGIYKGILYVTDIDELVEISIREGKIINRFSAKDSEFLNDIDIDENGNVFVSDMRTDNIRILQNDVFKIWLQSDEIVSPNGLYCENKNLLIGTKTKIISVNIKTKLISTLIDNTGSIDGLEYTGDGKYLFSDWKGHVFVASIGKTKKLILNTADKNINAADIEFIRDKQLLLIPTFYHNTVSFYKLVK